MAARRESEHSFEEENEIYVSPEPLQSQKVVSATAVQGPGEFGKSLDAGEFLTCLAVRKTSGLRLLENGWHNGTHCLTVHLPKIAHNSDFVFKEAGISILHVKKQLQYCVMCRFSDDRRLKLLPAAPQVLCTDLLIRDVLIKDSVEAKIMPLRVLGEIHLKGDAAKEAEGSHKSLTGCPSLS